MIKFLNTEVVFAEVPDEISLAINITNCPHSCKDCHSPWLQQDVGQSLTEDNFKVLLKEYDYVTCILFMGGDSEPDLIKNLARIAKRNKFKTAWYVGCNNIAHDILRFFDYLKVGPFVKELGGLTSKTTNQRFYHVNRTFMGKTKLVDKTHVFSTSRLQ